MGVKGLWEALNPVKKEVKISELKGQTLAVDLSGWICECKSVPGLPAVQIYRNLFYRTTHLMNLGVKMVFVTDGKPPDLKQKTLQQRQIKRGLTSKGRELFINSTYISKARQLLESLGLPCLQAEGEAEALCAFLSKIQLVDGCLTEDGDALLYGATRVYRNFSLAKQSDRVTSYSSADIRDSLGLTQSDLVALALLTGCDYDQEGVRSVGVDRALSLLKHLKPKHSSVLERMCSWRDCPDLDDLKKRRQSVKQDRHCSRCSHLGAVNVHKTDGCDVCKTEESCISDHDTADHHDNKPCLCPCDFHIVDRQYRENRLEIDIRGKALLHNNFPNMEIVKEFLESSESAPEHKLRWKKPALGDFVRNCCKVLSWSERMLVGKFIPTVVCCDMIARVNKDYFRDANSEELLEPSRIVKSCRKNFRACYEVLWKRLTSDIWTPADIQEYTSVVPQKVFTELFSEMVSEYNKSVELKKLETIRGKKVSKPKKRKGDEKSHHAEKQSNLKDFFPIKKAARSTSTV